MKSNSNPLLQTLIIMSLYLPPPNWRKTVVKDFSLAFVARAGGAGQSRDDQDRLPGQAGGRGSGCGAASPPTHLPFWLCQRQGRLEAGAAVHPQASDNNRCEPLPVWGYRGVQCAVTVRQGLDMERLLGLPEDWVRGQFYYSSAELDRISDSSYQDMEWVGVWNENLFIK